MPYLSSEARRQTILDAAVEVIATHGVAGATTRRIAERADAPLGALHYCFRNKAELIQLVGDRGAEMLSATFADVDPEQGLDATIRASVAALWTWVRDNTGLQLALLELAMWRVRQGGRPKELYGMWDRFGGDLMRDRFARAIAADGTRPAVPIDEVVRFINHRFDGLILEYAASQDKASCQRQTELLADAMVALALPAGAPGRAAAAKATKKPAAKKPAAKRRATGSR